MVCNLVGTVSVQDILGHNERKGPLECFIRPQCEILRFVERLCVCHVDDLLVDCYGFDGVPHVGHCLQSDERDQDTVDAQRLAVVVVQNRGPVYGVAGAVRLVPGYRDLHLDPVVQLDLLSRGASRRVEVRADRTELFVGRQDLVLAGTGAGVGAGAVAEVRGRRYYVFIRVRHCYVLYRLTRSVFRRRKPPVYKPRGKALGAGESHPFQPFAAASAK